METTRQAAKLAVALLLVAALNATGPQRASAQGPIRLTASESTVSHNISQSIERLEMLVKSSRILTLDERIPKFQVHNEEVLGATPISQNQLQVFLSHEPLVEDFEATIEHGLGKVLAPGACQAQIRLVCTPPWSITASVADMGRSSVGMLPLVQRRSESKTGSCVCRSVGCWAQASMMSCAMRGGVPQSSGGRRFQCSVACWKA